MSVGRICIREVDIAAPDETVQDAARRMRARNVGTLVILNDVRQPLGMLTDRDLAVRVVADCKDPTATRIADVMTASPEAVREDTPIEMALGVMRKGPFRRVPVVDEDGTLVGLVTLDDVLELLSEEFKQIGDLLADESPSCLPSC